MKKSIIYILLFSLSIPLPCAYMALLLKKHFIKMEVLLELGKKDHSLLTYIQLSKTDAENNLEWEHPWEFKYKDFKYDVLEKTVSGDSLVYVCWKDVEETKVDQQLAHLINSNPQQKENNKRIIDYLNKLFVSNSEKKLEVCFKQCASNNYQTEYYYLSPNLQIDIPPPKLD